MSFTKCLSNRAKWLLNLYLSLLFFIRNQNPIANSKPFVSNEHLKLLFSMFVFGNSHTQHGTKLVGLGIKSIATRKKIQWNHTQLLIIKIEYTMRDFMIFLISKRTKAIFLKKHPKSAISSSRNPNNLFFTFFTLNYRILPSITRRTCAKSFAKVNHTDCEIIRFEVERKVFLNCAKQGQ